MKGTRYLVLGLVFLLVLSGAALAVAPEAQQKVICTPRSCQSSSS